MQLPKLILGTANFGPKPYGQLKEPLSLNNINTITAYARCNGITVLEGSELYDCDQVVGNSYFDLIYKVKHPYNLQRKLAFLGRTSLLGLMYHHSETTKAQVLQKHSNVLYQGASVYEHKQLSGSEDMVEVPLNLEDKRFENLTAPCKIVRSVFGRGELLKKYSVKECLDYIKSINNIHGIVIGVDSVMQLSEILEAWNK